MKRNVLLLNADWMPLNFVSGIRAINLLFRGRAEIISFDEKPSTWNEVYSSPSKSYAAPATIRLLSRVSRQYMAPRFRKFALFNRDNWQCQYCGIKLDKKTVTIDHVVPRALGGITSWNNCVSSCKRCNLKKGSKLLKECGYKLNKNPGVPRLIHFWKLDHETTWHPDWINFFQPHIYDPCE